MGGLPMSVRDFLSELRRRRVFRATILYGVLSVALIEAADLVLPRIGLPEGAVTLIVVLAILGLPVAVYLAWAYDLTLEGLVRAPPTQFGSRRPASPAPLDTATSAELSDAEPTPTTRTTEGQAGLCSVAVLPFVDLSPQKDQGYFADGMADELLNALTSVEGLHVPGRTSSFALRGKDMDVRQIGEKLGVASILEGSVRMSQNRLRVTAHLVDVKTGYRLWSRNFDRELEDVFAVQEEIAASIVERLEVTLSERERDCMERTHTVELDAYDLYLRGKQLLHEATRSSVFDAVEAFHRAVELDPTYAPAYAGDAQAHVMLNLYWDPEPQHVEAARRASEKALELKPHLAEAHVSQGFALSQERKYEEADRHFGIALEVNPRLFDAYYFYARSLWVQGRFEEAAEQFTCAQRVRPEDHQSLALLATVYKNLERPDDALEAIRRMMDVIEKRLDLDPDDVRAISHKAGGHALLGNVEAARQCAQRAIELAPDDTTIHYNLACMYGNLGEVEPALDSLERALDAGFSHLEWIDHDSDLKPLRGHPRLEAIRKQLGA